MIDSTYLVVHLEYPEQLVLSRLQLRRVDRHHVLNKVKIPAFVLVKNLEAKKEDILNQY